MSRVGARHLVPVEEGRQPGRKTPKSKHVGWGQGERTVPTVPPRVNTSCVAGSRQQVWLSGPALSRELRVEPPCMRDATQKTGVVGVTGINMGIEFISLDRVVGYNDETLESHKSASTREMRMTMMRGDAFGQLEMDVLLLFVSAPSRLPSTWTVRRRLSATIQDRSINGLSYKQGCVLAVCW